MITMGLRAAPKCVSFAIYDTAASAVINVEDIRIPAAFALPEALKYVRCSVLDVLREYGVEHAGIRTTEPVAKTISIERVQIEGVIQEAFASSALIGYFSGPIAVVSALLGVDRTRFKAMTQRGENDLDVDGWGEMTEASREAVLCAVGAANA